MRKKRKQISQQFYSFMDGYCDAFDDLPDGAWQSACMEGVKSYNKQFGTRIDPHRGWLAWVTKGESETN